ncbi:MAG: hypothetical protein ABR555_04315 [Pyrinomonadaceae bacterium]
MNNKRVITLLMLMCFAVATLAPTVDASTFQRRTKKFDPDGEFLLIGKPAKSFENVSSIVLLRLKGTYLNARSGVYLTSNYLQRFSRATVTEQKFSFETIVRRGVTYIFDGHFLRGGVFAELSLDLDKAMLKGHLTKLVNGHKVAETDIEFSYFGGT